MNGRTPPTLLEAQRLESLHRLLILDSEPEPLFDHITRMAADVCDKPIALITFIDAERQWFKSAVGAGEVRETPREIAFCAHTIVGDTLLELPDTAADLRFVDNPLVCGAPGIRFYCGVPLTLDDGERVGTLCVLDTRPGHLTEAQAATLKSLADMATQALLMRRNLLTRALCARSEYERRLERSEAIHRRMVEHQKELVSLSSREGRLVYVNPAYAAHFGRDEATLVGSDLFVGVDADDQTDARRQMDEVFDSGEARKRDFRTLDANGDARWVSWVHSLQYDIDGVRMLHSVGRDVTQRKQLELALAEKERFLRQIADNLPMDVAYLDTQGRYLFVNQPHAQRLGVDRALMLGRTRSEVRNMPANETLRSHWTAALDGVPQQFQFEVPGHGPQVLLEAQLLPDVDAEGVVQGVLATALDITAKHSSERAVRELIAIFDNTPDFVTQTDWRGMLTYMNPAARQAIGIGAEQDISQLHFSAFTSQASHQRFRETGLPVAQKAGVWVGETTVQLVGGEEIPVSHMLITHHGDGGRIDRYSTVMRDISHEVSAKKDQQRYAATLRSVTESVPAMVGVVGTDRRYRFVNNALAAFFGTDSDSMTGRTMQEALGPVLYDAAAPWLERALAGEEVHFEKSPAGRNGGRYLAVSYIPMWLGNGQVDGFVSIVQDVTRHRLEELRLQHLSQRDTLTGLLNRAGFEMFLDQALRDPDIVVAQLALLYIDLDRFKPVNDTYGHAVGDSLLKQFAARLVQVVRPSDAVVRLGGDEFAIILTGVRDSQGMRLVADKVNELARAPFLIDEKAIEVSASVGSALGMNQDRSWSDLMQRADAQLYKAKAAGRDRSHSEATLEELTAPSLAGTAFVRG